MSLKAGTVSVCASKIAPRSQRLRGTCARQRFAFRCYLRGGCRHEPLKRNNRSSRSNPALHGTIGNSPDSCPHGHGRHVQHARMCRNAWRAWAHERLRPGKTHTAVTRRHTARSGITGPTWPSRPAVLLEDVKIHKPGATRGTPMTRATAARHDLNVSTCQSMAGFWKGSGSLAAREAISNEVESAHTTGFCEKPKLARPGCPDFVCRR